MTVASDFEHDRRADHPGIPPRPMSAILNDIVAQMMRLFRQEMALARVEASEKVGQAVSSIVMLAVGAVLVIPALVVLLDAGVAALIEVEFTPAIAALIVGGGTLALGAILAMIGYSRLKLDNLVPRRTINQLQRDAEAAKEQVR